MEAGVELGVYAGEWVFNASLERTSIPRREIRHGRGTFISFPTGAFYEGQWLFDKMHGQGRLIKPDGSVYEGKWEADSQTGFGKM